MPSLRRLPKNTVFLVCDARKALFLRNRGTAIKPSLETLRTLEADAAAAERDLKGNPPGRIPDIQPGDGTHGPKSAMEAPDYARLEEEAFAGRIVEECAAHVSPRGAEKLVIVAPPRLLGALRDAMPENLSQAILAEVPKTLTHSPVNEIAGHLVEPW